MTIIVELLHCFEEQEHLKGVSHISYFCGKILGKSSLRKEGFNSTGGLGYHAIIPAEAEAAGHIASAARKGREKRAGAQTVFSFFSPSPWNGSVCTEDTSPWNGSVYTEDTSPWNGSVCTEEVFPLRSSFTSMPPSALCPRQFCTPSVDHSY